MSKKKVSICVVILGIILLIVGFVLTINNNPDSVDSKPTLDDKSDTDQGFSESLSPDSDIVQSLYYMTRGYWYNSLGDNSYYFYENDKLLVSEMEKIYLFNLVYERLNRKGTFSTSQFVSEDVVKNEFKEIFGDNVTYSSLDFFNNGCFNVTYDSSLKQYSFLTTNGCVGLLKVDTKVVEAYRFENRIEIVEKVLFVKDGYDLYYDRDMTLPATGISIDDDDSNILKYVYTFNYDSTNDAYYFYSIEKVK